MYSSCFNESISVCEYEGVINKKDNITIIMYIIPLEYLSKIISRNFK